MAYYQVASMRLELRVVTPERDNSDVGSYAPGQSIGLETGTIDDQLRRDCADGRIEINCPLGTMATRPFVYGEDCGVIPDPCARVLRLAEQASYVLYGIEACPFGGVERANTPDVWFDVWYITSLDQSDFNTVRPPTTE